MPTLKTAVDFMVTRLVTLRPEQHVFDGIANLLKHNITGAPVVDGKQNYLGIFSEKCSLNVITTASKTASDCAAGFIKPVKARDFMSTNLITLAPETDVFEAIDTLLRNRISGAPVVSHEGDFIGVFSEKDSMNVLVAAAYDQLPTTNVGALMNFDLERTISPAADLFEVADIFVETPYRRLAVVEGNRLVGQVSRRDVLRAESELSAKAGNRLRSQPPQISKFRSAPANLVTKDSNLIESFMDRDACTISPSAGLLDVARIFRDTPFRRLPVLTEGVLAERKLIGQVSRRDVLIAASELLKPQRVRPHNLLYLSSLVAREEAPEF